MGQKKTMGSWQMITLLVLSVIILVTMFLPAYHIDRDALKKGMENAQIEEDYENKDDDIKTYTKGFKRKLKEQKKENGTDNSSISVFDLMTKSLSDICYNGKYGEGYAKRDMGAKNYDPLNKKHHMTRILLWVVYSLLLIVIVTTILGYCLKWIKYIPLGISTAYGVVASVIFMILRFTTINGVKKETGRLTEDFIDLGKFKAVNVDVNKIAPSFLSYAFLIGLILAVMVLSVSVLSMFVGGQEEGGDDVLEDPDGLDGWEDDWADPHEHKSDLKTIPAEGMRGPGYSGDMRRVDVFREENKRPTDIEIQRPQAVQEVPKKAVVRNGKVRCTKGTTAGPSGYAISQDRKVIVGKSPHQANLVIVNDTHISNVHCTVRYEPKTDTYIIKDHSTNGTYAGGDRLQKGMSVRCPAGTVLKLADGSTEITLG